MQTRRMLAVAATLNGDAVVAALREAGFESAGVARSADEALAMVGRAMPELLLADAVLPGADGVGLAQQVLHAPLNAYPFVIVACPSGLALPGADALPDGCAAVIPSPVDAEAIRRAASSLRPTALPPDRAAKLENLLNALGVPRHVGRDMLAAAVALTWRTRSRLDNLRDRVYPPAGAACGKTAAQAERAIRHVIDIAWRTGEIEQQQRIFGDTIDARRGRPTCGEMIAQLADILRWEG